MKKILAILLTVCILLPLFALLPAFAATPTEGFDFTDGDKWFYADGTLADAPRTIEAWIYVDPDRVDAIKSNGNACTIISNYNGFPGYAYWHLAVKYSGGKLYPYFEWNELHNNSTSTRKFNFTDAVVTPGEWIHIAVVIDAENNFCRCYKNGGYVQSNGADIWLGDITANVTELPLVIGNDNRFNTPDLRVFQGSIASISLYNDVRTAEEIASDHANGADINDANALAHWELPASGGPVTDQVGDVDLSFSKYWLTEEEMAAIRGNDFNPAYSFAVVGDIQYMTEHDAAYGTSHVADVHKWIADNVANKNIQYVMGMGDVTNRNIAQEWQVALDAVAQLNGKVPYSVINGNHDLYTSKTDNGDAIPGQTALGPTAIDGYFGADSTYVSQFTGENGGLYKEGSVCNTYYKFTVGTTKWLVVNLDFAPSDDVLKWANRVVAAHSDHKVIMTTHGYLHMDGTPISDEDSGSMVGDALNNGEEMWTKFASLHENIVMVLSGHMESNNIMMKQAKGVHGNTVTQFLIDQQAVDKPYMGTSWSKKEVTVNLLDDDGNPIIGEDGNPVTSYKNEKGETVKATKSYWCLNGVDTGVLAENKSYKNTNLHTSYPHPTATVGEDGYWYVNGAKFHDMKYTGMPLGLVAMFYFDEDGENVSVEWYSTLRNKYYQTCNQISFNMNNKQGLADQSSFPWNGLSIAPKGSGTESDPYIVENGGNLLWMANRVTEKGIVNLTGGGTLCFEDTYFKQICDIDLGGLVIKSIGYYHTSESEIEKAAAFAGHYDGGGYSIKNGRVINAISNQGININHTVGLFGCIWGATVENVTLDNVTVWSRNLTGGIVGRAVAPRNVDAPSDFNVISNCHMTASCRLVGVWQHGKSISTKEYGYNTRYRAGVVGSICAIAYASTIKGCTSAVRFEVDGEHSMAGGIAGMAGYNSVIEDCAFTGGITLTDMNTTVSPTFGGIVALLAPNYETETMNPGDDYRGTLTIRNCYNSGSFTYTGEAALPDGLEMHWGGILGHAKMLEKFSNGRAYLIENCYNLYEKAIETKLAGDADYWVGGIVGKADAGNYDAYDSLTVKNCASVAIAANGGDTEDSTNEYRTTGIHSLYGDLPVLAENVTTSVEEAIRLEILNAQNAGNGTKWYYGEGAPTVEANVGDLYLDIANGDVYSLELTWVKIGNIKGAQGEPGTPGTPGTPGDTGADGSKWYALNGTPAANAAALATAKKGDLYLDLDNGDVYEYTTEWARIGNIKGAQGEPGDPGKDGATWHTGNGVPTGTANENDLYLDLDNGDVYQYTTEWAKVGNIKANAPKVEIIDGFWYINDKPTGVKAEGVDGDAGSISNRLDISANGTWVIDDVDTGVSVKGDPGENGSTWYTGSGEPAQNATLLADAKAGDLYLDTVTNNVYKYADAVWTKIGNLKGDKGDPGKDGTTWHTGNGVPTISANENDLYLDLSEGDIYKYTGGWAKIGNIKGVGGENGKDGATWYAGSGEPAQNATLLADAKAGDLYLDTVTNNVYKYADAVWTKIGNLKGDKGDPGKDGTTWHTGNGVPTISANENDLYLDLDNGDVYQYTTEWAKVGNIKGVGVPGDPGTPGTPGQNGADGSTWYTGRGTPAQNAALLAEAKSGDLYLDAASNNVYKYTTEWTKIGNIEGEKGETGAPGENGAPGANGTNGKDGADGEDGADGKDGVTPQIRINSETGKWEVSYDKGATWQELGAVAENGDSTGTAQGGLNSGNSGDPATVTNDNGGSGKGLAIAAIVISVVLFATNIGLVAVLFIRRKRSA